jgi:gas vesicle protein
MNNKNNNCNSSSNFLPGFLLGVIAGAAGYFLLGTKKGRKIKKRLMEEGQDIWEDFDNVVEEVKKPINRSNKIEGKDVSRTRRTVREVKKFFHKNGKRLN